MKTSLFKSLAVAAALMLGLSLSAAAQSRVVKGVVSEMTETGKAPIIGAGVIIKGKPGTGTATNVKGEWSITVPADANTLVFSSIGYKDQEVQINGRSFIEVILEPDSEMLDDVVVVGYGVQRRSDVSGSVTSIKAEDLAMTPATNIAEMMRGKAAGVQINLSSGAPGSTSSIKIRGTRSLKGDSAPLFVIDGVVATEAEFNAVAPGDVENLEILKDAASQAIYGARAADGVVIVTTKRGSEEKASVTFTSSISSQHLWRNFDFYNGDEFYELRREAKAHAAQIWDPKLIEAYTPHEVLTCDVMEKNYEEKNYTDWEDLMFEPALIQKYDLSIRGGSKKLKVAASAGYLDHKGMVKIGSKYTRANMRVNMDFDVNKWLSIGTSSSYIKTSNISAPNSFTNYITMTPLGQPFNEDGTPTEYINTDNTKNPLYNAQYYKSQSDTDISRLNAYMNIKPFKGLNYKLNFGYYNRYQESASYKQKEYTGGGAAGKSTASKLYRYTLENILSYDVPFSNKDLKLNITGVQSYEHQTSKSIGFEANNVPVDKYWWYMIGDGDVTDKTYTFSEYYVLSYLLRAQFSYKGRYLANIAMRRDGSSRFGSDSKWGNFPSISAAWRINEEPWMKNVREISNLKLRASYGLVGNMSPIGNYETLGAVTDYEYEFGDKHYIGYLPGNSLPNNYLQWESTASMNLGIDFGLFKNRLNGTIEFYNTYTNNLLFSRSINAALGYTTMTDNVARTRTNGIDINIDGAIIRSKDIDLTAGIVFSTFNNEIVRLNGELDESGKPINDIANKWFIGSPINVYYTFETDGIYQFDDFDMNLSDPSTNTWVLKEENKIERTDKIEPGKIKVVNQNGDNKIDADDRIIVNKDPDFVASFNMGFRYKGFDVYMDWYGVYGVNRQNAWLYDYDNGGSLQGKLNGIKVNYWTPSNPSNEAPRPTYDEATSYHDAMSMCDASYLRLRTLAMGYTFPAKLLSKINVNSAKITLTATNLLTFTKFKSYSPETTPGTYPEPRQFNATLTFTF